MIGRHHTLAIAAALLAAAPTAHGSVEVSHPEPLGPLVDRRPLYKRKRLKTYSQKLHDRLTKRR